MDGGQPTARPIIVVEGSDDAVAAVIDEVRLAGWRIRPEFGWIGQSAANVVRSGTVASAEDAVAALVAALAGYGVIIAGRADRTVMDRLLDDLRHVGRVDHRIVPFASVPALDGESAALLKRLADGDTLGEAAHALGISRRTADRRLAAARQHLGVERTAEAVSRAQRLGLLR